MLRFPEFYASPRCRFEFGSLFRKTGLLIRVARTLFYFFNTPRMKTRFFVIIGKSAKSVGNCSLFSWVQKTSVSAERCRKNRDNDFQSGFVGKIGRQNMHYSLVAAHDFKTEEENPMDFSFFCYGPEFARGILGNSHPQTLRIRGIRGVDFIGVSVARVWRVRGRPNTGNPRAEAFQKIKNTMISMVWVLRDAPHSRNSWVRFYRSVCGSSLARSRASEHRKSSSG